MMEEVRNVPNSVDDLIKAVKKEEARLRELVAVSVQLGTLKAESHNTDPELRERISKHLLKILVHEKNTNGLRSELGKYAQSLKREG